MKGLLGLSPRMLRAFEVIAILVITNLFVAVGMLGIVTGGAVITAGYAVMSRVHTIRIGDVPGVLWRVARRSFLASIPVWLVILAVGAGTYQAMFALQHGHAGVLAIAIRVLLALVFLVVVIAGVWYFLLLGLIPGRRHGLGRLVPHAIATYPRQTLLSLLVVVVPVSVAAVSIAAAARLGGFYCVIGVAITLYLQVVALYQPACTMIGRGRVLAKRHL